MRIRDGLIFIAWVLTAALVGRQFAPGAEERGDIVVNEKVCSDTAPKGFAAYPITRMGELRGCLFVDETDPARFKVARRTRL